MTHAPNPRISLFAISLIGWSLIVVPALADSGGTVTGRVTFSGKIPSPKEFVFAKFPNPAFCAKNPNKTADGKVRLLEQVKATEDGGLQDAIVAVRDLTDDAWMKSYKGTEVSAVLCEWSTFTGVVVKRGRFIVENTDADPSDPKSSKGVLHNPHGFEVLKARSTTMFNIALAQKGDKLDKKVILRKTKAGSVMRLQCDQHEFMQAWFLPVTNPYFAKVNEDGTYEIKGVPPGKHRLVAWHPKAGLLERDIEVTDGGTVKMEFDLKGS